MAISFEENYHAVNNNKCVKAKKRQPASTGGKTFKLIGLPTLAKKTQRTTGKDVKVDSKQINFKTY